jgi:hypothetical protein
LHRQIVELKEQLGNEEHLHEVSSDKSNLSSDYFIFYKKAFEMLEKCGYHINELLSKAF